MKFNKAISGVFLLLLPVVCSANLNIVRKPVGKGIYELAYDSYGRKLLVTSTGERTEPGGYVYLLDPTNLNIIEKIAISTKPFGAAINNRIHTAWFTDSIDGSVTAVDLIKKKVIKTIQLVKKTNHSNSNPDKKSSPHTMTQGNDDNRPPSPREIRIDEQHNLIYVSGVNRKDSVIWVINGNNYMIEDTINGYGKLNTGLAVSADGSKIYSTNAEGYFITTDAISRKILTKHKITDDDQEHLFMNIALDERHRRAFISDNKSKKLYIVDTISGVIINTISTPESIGIYYQSSKNRLYLAHRNTGSVSVIDTISMTTLEDISIPSHPNSIIGNESGDSVYVSVKQDAPRGHPSHLPDDVVMLK